MRLDSYLFEKGFATSRNKASEMIKNREVFVDDVLITKSSFDVAQDMQVRVENSSNYVSRAGNKLEGFLQESSLDVTGLNCLDIGSSTGGFVEVLLKRGAKHITAVDVGKEQLHINLRDNATITLHEQTDIRDFQAKESYDLLTCDVSFISIENIIMDIDRLASKHILILFKPQFEVGKEVKRTKKGVVKDQKVIQRVMSDFEARAFGLGWDIVEKKDSVLKGKEGNIETFYCFKKR